MGFASRRAELGMQALYYTNEDKLHEEEGRGGGMYDPLSEKLLFPGSVVRRMN